MQVFSWITSSIGWLNATTFYNNTHNNEQVKKIEEILKKIDIRSINESMDLILSETDLGTATLMSEALKAKISPTMNSRIGSVLIQMSTVPYKELLNRDDDIGYFDSDRQLGHMMDTLVGLTFEEESLANELEQIEFIKKDLETHNDEKGDLNSIIEDLNKRGETLTQSLKEIKSLNREINVILTGYFSYLADIYSTDNNPDESAHDELRSCLGKVVIPILERVSTLKSRHQRAIYTQNLQTQNLRNEALKFKAEKKLENQCSLMEMLSNYYDSQNQNLPCKEFNFQDKDNTTEYYESLIQNITATPFSAYCGTSVFDTTHFINTASGAGKTKEPIYNNSTKQAAEFFSQRTGYKKTNTFQADHGTKKSPLHDRNINTLTQVMDDLDIDEIPIPINIRKALAKDKGIEPDGITWEDIKDYPRDKIYQLAGSIGTVIMYLFDWKNSRSDPSCDPSDIAETWKELKESHPDFTKPFLYYITKWGMWQDEKSIEQDLIDIAEGNLKGNSFYDQWLNEFVLFSTMAKAMYVLKDRPESIATVTDIIDDITTNTTVTDDELERLTSLKGFLQTEIKEHSHNLAKMLKLGLETDEHSVANLMKTVLKDGKTTKEFLTGISNIAANLQNDPVKSEKFNQLVNKSLDKAAENQEAIKAIIEGASQAIERDPTIKQIVSDGTDGVIDLLNNRPEAANLLLDVVLNHPDLVDNATKIGSKMDMHAAEVLTKTVFNDGEQAKDALLSLATYADFLSKNPKKEKLFNENIGIISNFLDQHDEGIAEFLNNCSGALEDNPKRQQAFLDLVKSSSNMIQTNPKRANFIARGALKAISAYRNFLTNPTSVPEYMDIVAPDDPELAAYFVLQRAKKGNPSEIIARDFATVLDTANWVKEKREKYLPSAIPSQKMSPPPTTNKPTYPSIFTQNPSLLINRGLVPPVDTLLKTRSYWLNQRF